MLPVLASSIFVPCSILSRLLQTPLPCCRLILVLLRLSSHSLSTTTAVLHSHYLCRDCWVHCSKIALLLTALPPARCKCLPRQPILARLPRLQVKQHHRVHILQRAALHTYDRLITLTAATDAACCPVICCLAEVDDAGEETDDDVPLPADDEMTDIPATADDDGDGDDGEGDDEEATPQFNATVIHSYKSPAYLAKKAASTAARFRQAKIIISGEQYHKYPAHRTRLPAPASQQQSVPEEEVLRRHSLSHLLHGSPDEAALCRCGRVWSGEGVGQGRGQCTAGGATSTAGRNQVSDPGSELSGR